MAYLPPAIGVTIGIDSHSQQKAIAAGHHLKIEWEGTGVDSHSQQEATKKFTCLFTDPTRFDFDQGIAVA
jgi:hypothetical protein